jgi:hypothetical protein
MDNIYSIHGRGEIYTPSWTAVSNSLVETILATKEHIGG